MKTKASWLVLTAALLAFVPMTILIAADAAQERLAGEYVWNYGSEGPLEAVFVATGERSWDVDFHFTFDGSRHVYSGTAQGSVSEGKLAGRVKNEDKRRTFTFEGSFEGSVFRGTHAEIRNGRVSRTGTLTLER